MDGEFTKVGEAAMLLLHLPDAIEAHRNDRYVEILGEEADAGLERDHLGGVTVVDDAFRKDQQTVAAIHGFTGKTKTLAEAGKLRERKDVEERNH